MSAALLLALRSAALLLASLPTLTARRGQPPSRPRARSAARTPSDRRPPATRRLLRRPFAAGGVIHRSAKRSAQRRAPSPSSQVRISGSSGFSSPNPPPMSALLASRGRARTSLTTTASRILTRQPCTTTPSECRGAPAALLPAGGHRRGRRRCESNGEDGRAGDPFGRLEPDAPPSRPRAGPSARAGPGKPRGPWPCRPC